MMIMIIIMIQIHLNGIINETFVARIELLSSESYNNTDLILNENLYNPIPDRHTNRDYYDESIVVFYKQLNYLYMI